MPEETFERMISSLEKSAEQNPTANHMLRKFPADRLYRLGKLALK